MALTLGQQLEEVQTAISKVLIAQSYQNGDKQLNRAALFRLEDRERKLISKISIHGRNYIEGSNTKSKKACVGVSFG